MKISLKNGALVVTSISGPNPVLKSLAEGAMARGIPFIVIGDSKSPADFELPGCDFYSLDRQRRLPFAYARLCHEKSYARKNIGYLLAIAGGARLMVETDDDNYPQEDFWADRNSVVEGALVSSGDWVNAYAYFSDTSIYPRGFPIEHLLAASAKTHVRAAPTPVDCPIQQGLADNNPDVDAIYRMLLPLPITFRRDTPVILGPKTWCPFNSQNTTVFREAFPLLYLPTFCSFRMTDIWRSYIAQRILWTCGWRLSFHAATVYQERNEHDLLRDFADEVPGYLNNARIARELDTLELAPGPDAIAPNLKLCYKKLVQMGLILEPELVLLDAWLEDLQKAGSEKPLP